MPNPFDDYDLKKATEVVSGRFDAQAAINLAFYNGDHFQGGEGWIGPRRTLDDALYQASMKEIERGFISHNVIAEVTSRHVSGVLGRELHWAFTVKRELESVQVTDPVTGELVMREGEPTDEEKALIAEAEAALVAWWDKREIPEILQNMLAGALNIKRAPLRLHVPPGLRDQSGNLPPGDLAACLDMIWLQHLGTDEDTLNQQVPSATVYTDKNTRRDVGIFTYKDADKDAAELSYVGDDGQTVLRIIGAEGAESAPLLLPLGGRLTLYELTRSCLITPQIVSQQKALNMAMSMKQRNAVMGGFLERVLLNVKWPSKTTTNADGSTTETPLPLNVGPGTTNSFQGAEFTDENGNVRVANPSISYRDPVSPLTFIQTEDSIYLSMLQEAQQLHYALAGDAVVSGESRKQARDAFHKDLQFSAGKVEAAARWALETVLAMASFFANQPGRFEVLRAMVQAHVDSGPISAEEMTVAADMYDRGVWAKETAQSETGIEDVDAENARIDQEQAKRSLRETNLAQAALDEAKRKFDQERNGVPVIAPVLNGQEA